jgi:hypothetical protein
MPPTLSLRAYARHRQVRPSAVHKALADRRLTKASAHQDARGRWAIDPIAADQEWAHNTAPDLGGDRRPGPPRTNRVTLASDNPALPAYEASCALVAHLGALEADFERALDATLRTATDSVDTLEARWRPYMTRWPALLPALEQLQTALTRLAVACEIDDGPGR